MKTNNIAGFYCHWKTLYALAVFLYLSGSLYAQIGVGAEANVSYPGVFTSDKNNIRFKTGIGYGFFIRHDVYKAQNWQAHLRYRATVSHHKANLPFEEKSDYKFSNFGIDLLIHFVIYQRSNFYSGLSVNLLSTVVENKYYKDFSSEKILPSILLGWNYNWAEGFDLYTEINTRFGSVDAGPDSEHLPVTGVGLNVGITMYISDE